MTNNPYKAPKAELETGAARKRSIFWKIYFVFIMLVTFVGYLGFFTMPGGYGGAEIISCVLSVIFSIGFFGFCFDKKILNPQFWSITLLVFIIWSIAYYFVTDVDLTSGQGEMFLYVSQAIGWLISLPSLIGLYLYSRSKQPVWNTST